MGEELERCGFVKGKKGWGGGDMEVGGGDDVRMWVEGKGIVEGSEWEKGGIDGERGDERGKEMWVGCYYDVGYENRVDYGYGGKKEKGEKVMER